MIDTLAIFVSTALVVFVVFRAYLANRKETWFTATPAEEDSPDRPSHFSGRTRAKYPVRSRTYPAARKR